MDTWSPCTTQLAILSFSTCPHKSTQRWHFEHDRPMCLRTCKTTSHFASEGPMCVQQWKTQRGFHTTNPCEWNLEPSAMWKSSMFSLSVNATLLNKLLHVGASRHLSTASGGTSGLPLKLQWLVHLLCRRTTSHSSDKTSAALWGGVMSTSSSLKFRDPIMKVDLHQPEEIKLNTSLNLIILN